MIEVRNLSKRYCVAPRLRYRTLRESMVNVVNAPLRHLRGQQNAGDEFWALSDVSFDVAPGECMGIIGRNGAGKSTLLKILSRITDPTAGHVELGGRVGSLLEVGTGFHNELSGRDNIFLNGSILGMKRAEIRRKFDEIVSFAEVDQFIDTPVKRYSSGMYMRLAFAVAAYLEPDILVVDEVLAVGDAAFQKKCLGKMSDVAGRGRTVLFVSHNMAAVQSLCGRAIHLQQGTVVDEGPAADVVSRYMRQVEDASAVALADRRDRRGAGGARLTSVKIEPLAPDTVIRPGARLKVTIGYESDDVLSSPRFIVNFYDPSNVVICALDNTFTGELPDWLPARGVVTCVTEPIAITPGRCFVSLELWSSGATIVDAVDHAAWLDVEDYDFFGTGRLSPRDWAMCLLRQKWSANGGEAEG